MRHILHDWNDESALQILRTVRAAIPAGTEASTVLLLQEVVMHDGQAVEHFETLADLQVGAMSLGLLCCWLVGLRLIPSLLPLCAPQMMALADGKERSRGEWDALLRTAGFKLARVHPVRSPSIIIEAHPV